MFKKLGLILLLIVILCSLGWNIYQWQGINKRILSLDAKIGKILKEERITEGAAGSGQKGYELTMDMWQTFEKQLQDYKQSLREGNQQYTEQQSKWNSLLTDLKKNLQEYDKFITAEGDFWEKQLKNYDKMLAKTEERFDILGQVIEELKSVTAEFQNWLTARESELKEKEKEVAPIEEKPEGTPPPRQQIIPQIRGEGEYKTYPPKEEEGEPTEEEKKGVIRGTVTGSGEYQTY